MTRFSRMHLAKALSQGNGRRKSDPSNWKKNKNKYARHHGKQHLSASGKVISPAPNSKIVGFLATESSLGNSVRRFLMTFINWMPQPSDSTSCPNDQRSSPLASQTQPENEPPTISGTFRGSAFATIGCPARMATAKEDCES